MRSDMMISYRSLNNVTNVRSSRVLMEPGTACGEVALVVDTLVKKAYELGGFDGVDVALIICKHGQYTTYGSGDHAPCPPSMAEIVSSRSIDTYDWC